MSSDIAVAFDSVTKTFESLVANRNITFQVGTGTVHALVGENGAGKTTLMRILCGNLRQDAGVVSVFGKPLEVRSSREAILQGIGMVFQKMSLIPQFTVFENLLLGSSGSRLKRSAGQRFA